MNTYYYRLLNEEGRVKSGFLRLAVERDFSARLWLERRHGGVVLSLLRLPGFLGDVKSGLLRRPMRPEDLGGFLRDLAIMTGAGVPMLDSLRAIAEEGEFSGQRRIAGIARALLDDLDAGASVSESFARHPDIFPETVRNLVAIGDETGAMDRMLMEAAEHIERLGNMARDARRALIYPAFVFTAIIGAALFWILYVIPHLSGLFTQMRVELPAITVAVLGLSEWLTAHLSLAIWLVAGGVLLVWLAIRESGRFRHALFALAHRLPVARVIVRSSGMAFITEHLALLIIAGLDMVRSLAVLERSIGDEFYRSKIAEVKRVVERGERLAAAMRQVGGFPAMAVRMISVGEETGSLDQQLRHLAAEYRARLDHVVESLAEIIKPAVILFAGGIFLLMVVALLLPVYDLVRQAVTSPMM
ncbi:type II secretion system F family protein [Thauera sp. CAU 1555]|uniref:Type II secretion system F family protein n=1 Tax=Thauera sedimentorum TaxID=2767595 RepID=A0ABR9BDX7_9RHOO|nr:type II secretion system F family protein [Thauera sedimentorum]MBC9072728.1 type II secretion system F family protein [Thauera sedimentorum]MBD8503647.1 type II secretion system F family protein [Thauera sedimentorum]